MGRARRKQSRAVIGWWEGSELRDNAVAESFFSTLKNEQTLHERYRTHADARAAIFGFMELFYNPVRQHSHPGGLSPMQFERAQARLTTCP